MKTMIFGGSSDDTFGEITARGDDYDNCGSGAPIEWLIQDPPTGDAMLVVGQYCPSAAGGWLVGVARPAFVADDEHLPDWPVRIVRSDRTYSPALEIDVPDTATLRCIQRGHDTDEG